MDDILPGVAHRESKLEHVKPFILLGLSHGESLSFLGVNLLLTQSFQFMNIMYVNYVSPPQHIS